MKDVGKWFAVVNPHAGSGRTAQEWKKAEALLSSRGIAYTSSMTDCRRHATEIAYTAACEGYRRFLAVGGDGTVHEVLGGLASAIGDAIRNGEDIRLSDFYLAVVPIGSGNDWIRTHGIRHDIGHVVDLIEAGSFVPQDIAKVTVLEPAPGTPGSEGGFPGPFAYMINIAGTGLDAHVCERVNIQKSQGRRSRLIYVNSLVYNLLHNKPSPVTVQCDGNVVFAGDCLSIAFGIGRYSGGGLRQTPDAIPDDGLLDYTVIPRITFSDALRYGPGLFDGTFTKSPLLTVGRCRSVEVRPLSEEKVPVEVDGEILGRLPVRIDVLPQKINVLHSFTQDRHQG